MSLGLSRWDGAESLVDDETIRILLDEVVKDGDPDEIADWIGRVARALGMAELAKRAGLPRDKVFAAVNAVEDRDPQTISRILNALGVRSKADHPADAAE